MKRTHFIKRCLISVLIVVAGAQLPTNARAQSSPGESGPAIPTAQVIFADPATRDALQNDPVLKTLMSQKPVVLIEALMPGVNDGERILEPAQRSALDVIQRRLLDENGILSFVWIGKTDQIQRAAADNVRLVRDRTDGKKAIVLLYSDDPARHVFLCSGPLVDLLGGRDAASSAITFSIEPNQYRQAPGAGIVSQTATILNRIQSAAASVSGAGQQVTSPASPEIRRSAMIHTTADTAPAAQPPERVAAVEPREILIMSLAAGAGGLLVGLLMTLSQSRKRRGRARDIMSSHFVVTEDAVAPVPASRGPNTMDFSRVAAALPGSDASVEERLGLAQTRLLELRETARRLQQTVNQSTMELLAHVESEVAELETLRRALQR
jgi:hypothetical protein